MQRRQRMMVVALVAAAFAAPVAWADAAGEQLAKDKGCTACPAVKLAEKVIKGGQGVWGPVPMPPNKISDDDAKKLVAYVLSL